MLLEYTMEGMIYSRTYFNLLNEMIVVEVHYGPGHAFGINSVVLYTHATTVLGKTFSSYCRSRSFVRNTCG